MPALCRTSPPTVTLDNAVSSLFGLAVVELPRGIHTHSVLDLVAF
jgi:hypothetical protein